MTSTWDERALLILGVLKTQSGHGYFINDVIQRQVGNLVNLKRPTVYALLDRLSSHGMISITLEQHGNRPLRKVYHLTEAGHALFEHLLDAELATMGEVGVLFLDQVEPETAINALSQCLNVIEDSLSSMNDDDISDESFAIELVQSRRRAILAAERDWLLTMLKETTTNIVDRD